MEFSAALAACLERVYTLLFGFRWLFKAICRSDAHLSTLFLALEVFKGQNQSRPTYSPSTGVNIVSLGHNYIKHTHIALEVLQDDYNDTTGLWASTGWWNAANCLTMVTNYAIAHDDVHDRVVKVLEHSYVNASGINAPAAIRKLINGTPTTLAFDGGAVQPLDFLNDFYDDEAWWAIGWIRAFDLTRNATYLATAASIFDDLVLGHKAPCGGLWWNKPHDGEVAITNSLFIETAAALANRAAFIPRASHAPRTRARSYYRRWAMRSWTWFDASGLINKDHLVNDGLDASTCANNGGIVWSYNQGALVGALVELFGVTADATLLSRAADIAHATINALADSNGILHDVCEPNCGRDGTQFKGVFLRALSRLHTVQPDQKFADFMRRNADSILSNNRNERHELSVNWAGPFVSPANASTHCSAMDALVAVLGLAPRKED